VLIRVDADTPVNCKPSDSMEPSATPEIHELDVRPILASGGSPLTAVLEEVAALPLSASLRLIAPFEPVPMFAKLADLGFDHAVHRRDDGTFEILFTRQAPPPEPVVLDLRQTVPAAQSEPVLAAIRSLGARQLLIIRTLQHPEPLFACLSEAGAIWETEELPDGTWQTCIAPPLGS